MLRPWTLSEPASQETGARESGAPGILATNPHLLSPGDGLVEMELSFVLGNDPTLIPPLLSRLREAADQLRLFDAETADRVDLVLYEALVNGIHHGNLELDSDLRQASEAAYHRLAQRHRQLPRYRARCLHVRARLSRSEAVYIIRDEGPGFDPSRLPDPTDPANLERAGGRGLLLIRAFMDEVAFNAAGNQITLTKRRSGTPDAPHRPPPPPESQVLKDVGWDSGQRLDESAISSPRESAIPGVGDAMPR
jgi:anti-sigma regulatory factor (Ser/Thr protein kinase)